MANYLDETGLRTLWTKIKNTFALSGHTHSGYVPTSRTINGKALSSNISLTASDVGAASASSIAVKSVTFTEQTAGSSDVTLSAMSVGELRFARVNLKKKSLYLPSGGQYYVLYSASFSIIASLAGGSLIYTSESSYEGRGFLVYRAS